MPSTTTTATSAHDRDVILLLEHDHVYTLGRGADENHLTFLQDHQDETELRQRLARTNRGPGSARLSVDSTVLQSLQEDPPQGNSDDPHEDTWHHNVQAVRSLSSWATYTCHPVLAPNQVPIYRVERGGQVTYHGPGQLVVYPLLDLKQGQPLRDDLHWFLYVMEEVILRTCARVGIDTAVRDEINTGVWVGHNKVAAVGVAASRWITTHGFALNVDPDLRYFDTSVILPCGIQGRGVTSIAKLLRERQEQTGELVHIPTIHEVASIVLDEMEQVLQIELGAPERLEWEETSVI